MRVAPSVPVEGYHDQNLALLSDFVGATVAVHANHLDEFVAERLDKLGESLTRAFSMQGCVVDFWPDTNICTIADDILNRRIISNATEGRLGRNGMRSATKMAFVFVGGAVAVNGALVPSQFPKAYSRLHGGLSEINPSPEYAASTLYLMYMRVGSEVLAAERGEAVYATLDPDKVKLYGEYALDVLAGYVGTLAESV